MDMFAYCTDQYLEKELDKAMDKYELFNMKERRAHNDGRPVDAAIFKAFAERWEKRADNILVTLATR